MTDTLQRFVFDHLDARGAIVRLQESCQAIQATHHYPPALAQLLNQFAAAACLLRDSIKVAASVTIQLRGSESVKLIMADCLVDHRVRAIAEYDPVRLPAAEEFDLKVFLAESVLAITITPQDGERYQGIVPIEHASLEACLEGYFARSEQLPTLFRLLADEEQTVGIAIHSLPAEKVVDADLTVEHFRRLRLLLNSLKGEEALSLSKEQILTRLFHQESCRLFTATPVEFGCECSQEKSLNAVVSLGAAQVAALLAEQRQEGNQSLTVDCHFCFQRYEFDLDEIESVMTA